MLRAGGFSRAPKCPFPGIRQFLMTYHAARPHNGRLNRERAEKALNMTMTTLSAMAHGGIFDHLGGGFHRYATDGQWQIPHFEKMLCDNAQLLSVYTRAYQLTGDPEMATTARRAVDFIFDRRYDHDIQSLFRCRVDSDPEILGIADDHLFFVQALLDKTVALFYDTDADGFFMTRRNTMPT